LFPCPPNCPQTPAVAEGDPAPTGGAYTLEQMLDWGEHAFERGRKFAPAVAEGDPAPTGGAYTLEQMLDWGEHAFERGRKSAADPQE
jgi:hypothetical protein